VIVVLEAGFKFCALHYMNQWISQDRAYCEALAGHNRSKKLDTLRSAAAFYRIARTLHKRYEEREGLQRFEPVLDIIDAQTREDFEGDKLLLAIEKVRIEISRKYGDRGVLSLTTKFLWLKIKSPVIIYDSRASRALRTVPGDIGDYYAEWRKTYESFSEQIDVACSSLQDVFEYTLNPKLATRKFIAETAVQHWFKERVLDIYLWYRGSGGQPRGETKSGAGRVRSKSKG
jgi:hypothetical protein